MPSNVDFPPLGCWSGTSPIHAANFRPQLKQLASPIEATSAFAVMGPIPGICANLRLTSLSRWGFDLLLTAAAAP
jgi:hypothetical protein